MTKAVTEFPQLLTKHRVDRKSSGVLNTIPQQLLSEALPFVTAGFTPTVRALWRASIQERDVFSGVSMVHKRVHFGIMILKMKV